MVTFTFEEPDSTEGIQITIVAFQPAHLVQGSFFENMYLRPLNVT